MENESKNTAQDIKCQVCDIERRRTILESIQKQEDCEMRIEGNTVIFRSTPSMYEKEESGKKPNTVRILDDDEALPIMTMGEDLTCIRIERWDHHGFTRELIDISVVGRLLGKTICVFSWRHEG